MPFPSILLQRARRGRIAVAAKIQVPRAIGTWKGWESKRGFARLQIGQSPDRNPCGLAAYAAAGDPWFPPMHFVLASWPESCHNWSTARGLPAAGGSARSIRIGCLGSFVQMRRRHVPNRSNASGTISRLCRAAGPVLLPSPVVLPWKEYRCAPQEGEVA